MAFVLRRPGIVTASIRAVPQLSKPTIQSFSQRFAYSRPQTTNIPLSRVKEVFRATFRRHYTPNASPIVTSDGGALRQRLVYGAAIFGGTIFAINMVFNRETREDGGMPPFERSYLNDTFLHTGLGLGIIAVAATSLHRSGWSYRLMAASPWVSVGLGLVGSIGTMIACQMTPPENYIVKYGFWTAFNVTQAAILSPLLFLQPALLARAGLYTVGMMGSLAFVGATAKQEKYLYLGGPLLAGVAVVALSGLAPLVIPATATRTLMWTENLWLYGGLAVFGGFTLYDVQKVLYRARLAERGLIKRDAVNESIAFELNFLNIFIRMVQILGMSGNRRK